MAFTVCQKRRFESQLEVTMSRSKLLAKLAAKKSQSRSKLATSTLPIVAILLLAPTFAHAQGSRFDTGFNALQTLFIGTIAKVASLIAMVIGELMVNPARKKRSPESLREQALRFSRSTF